MGAMSAAVGALTGRLDANANFRFLVMVDDITFAMFSEIQLPTLQVSTTDIQEGGQNQYKALPVQLLGIISISLSGCPIGSAFLLFQALSKYLLIHPAVF